MSGRLALAVLALAAKILAQNAPSDLPCGFKDQVKDGNAYRIATPNLVYVNCDVTDLVDFQTTAKLYAVTSNGRTADNEVKGKVTRYPGSAWIRIELTRGNGDKTALTGGREYELELAPDGNAIILKRIPGKSPAPLAGPFTPLAVPVSTSASGTIGTRRIATSGSQFLVSSNIAFAPFQPNGPKLAEVLKPKVLTYHEVRTTKIGTVVEPCLGSCPEPPVADNNPLSFGQVQMDLESDELYQPKVTIQVEGLTNVFGAPVKVKNEIALGPVPKTKDDSILYAKITHQAGVGSKPGFVLDFKIAPQLGRPALLGFYWKPAVAVDIGAGSVAGVKTNDLIVPSLGLTRLYRTHRHGLEAVRVTPALSFETNREFTKKNVIYDQDVQFFVSSLTLSRAARSWRLVDKKNDATLVYSPDLSNWGAGVKLFLGTELGHGLMEQTVKASKGTAAVTVPNYAVARLRPRITAFAEYKRISLSFTAALRYLMMDEFTTRESADGKSIRLATMSGFRPYGEAGITIGLDPSGHIALSTTYKLGSQPPTYVVTNTVQTGLLIRY